ncbi:MAG: NAD(P)-binding domain-containing protein [Flavobacteriales bacterium]|nr:NAD(P)-binding domain-containing protein [Flavobacteriales bacterium]
MKKIGILGSGAVAKTLGSGFLRHGHEVMLGTRDASKLDAWLGQNANATVGTFAATAAWADSIVLAVKGTAAKSALEMAGATNLSGKTVIDTTNPIDGAPTNGVLRYFTLQNDSLMEQLQAAFPNAHFVKAWNSIGSAYMVNPTFTEGMPSMFICGNNDAARAEVSAILVRFGFEVEDMGLAEAARAIEPLCMLWCIPGFREGRWSHAFRLLKK